MFEKWKIARAVVKQIKRGEWSLEFNSTTNSCCTASRNELELWVGNGGYFCELSEASRLRSNAFGPLFRHYVWWAAARRAVRNENIKCRRERSLALLSSVLSELA